MDEHKRHPIEYVEANYEKFRSDQPIIITESKFCLIVLGALISGAFLACVFAMIGGGSVQ